MKEQVMDALRSAEDNFGRIDAHGKNYISKDDIQTFLRTQKDKESQQMGETLLHNFPALTQMNDWGAPASNDGITRKNLDLTLGLVNTGSLWDYSYPAAHTDKLYIINGTVGMLGAALGAAAIFLPQLRSARAFEVSVGAYAVACSGVVGGLGGLMLGGLVGDLDMKRADNYYQRRLSDAQRMVP